MNLGRFCENWTGLPYLRHILEAFRTRLVGAKRKCAAMSDLRDQFDYRLYRLSKKRKKGVGARHSALMDSDGYMIVRGFEQRRGLPFKGLFLLAVGFICLKGLMMATMGEGAYAAKVSDLLETQSAVSQLGVWAMKADPVSSFVADNIKDYL